MFHHFYQNLNQHQFYINDLIRNPLSLVLVILCSDMFFQHMYNI